VKFSSKKPEQASVLVVTLITCGVIATVLASYLVLLSTRYNVNARSMCWNSAMPVLEAGIEEAMTHLQADTNSPSANGWASGTVGGQPVNSKRRNFADGSYFNVAIYNAASLSPTIYSSGFVPAPYGRGYISRTVRVLTTKPRAFGVPISANGQVTISGGYTDSYNSCLGAYSTNSNGLGTNGSVATDYKALKAISLSGSAHIYGTATTGPGGTVYASGGSSVGDNAWNATSTGVEPGWSDDTMNVAFPTNAPPAGPFTMLPSPTVVGGSNITYVPTGTYIASAFTSSSKTKPMIVTGNAIIYLTGNVTVSGDGFIQIMPGASLTLYVGGGNPTISGGGVINGTLQAVNFSYYGLNTSTKLTVSGGGTFIGTINAPQADLVISGSGDIYGSAIVNTYNNSGGANFHYDECLGAPGNFYTITSWREL
jgi:hypothetical protein